MASSTLAPEVNAPASAQPTAQAMLTCVSCGGDNLPGSRFCSHCGAALLPVAALAHGTSNGASHNGGAPATVSVTASHGALVNGSAANGAAGSETAGRSELAATESVSDPGASLDGAADREAMTDASAVIDRRRSRQLLDRAFMLTERGDIAAALLACRQSIALTPDSVASYSMLGLLFERSGDVRNAIAAYEKVLQLAPDSALERESLQRLRNMVADSKVSGFHFDDTDLFPDATSAPAALAVSATTAAPASDSAPRGAVPTSSAGIPVTAAEVAAMPPASLVAAASAPGAGAPMASAFAAPTMGIPASGLNTSGLNGMANVAPLNLDVPMAPALTGSQKVQSMMRRPSFYFRGAPVVAAAGLSLVFLLWARDWAASRSVAVEPGTDTTTLTQNQTPSGTTNPNVGGIPAPPSDAGAPLDNSPANTSGAGTASNTNRPVPNGANGNAANGGANANRAANGGRNTAPQATNGGQRVAAPANNQPVPRFPAVNTRPAAPPSGNEIPPALPAPSIPMSSSSSDTTIGTGRSSGGGLVGPGNGGNGTTITIRPRTPATAGVRPSSRVSAAERAASADAARGHTDSAIARMNASVAQGGSDTGYRYQQIAMLYLQKGDGSNAIQNFNMAIAAYRDRIRMNDRPDEARTGIQSCQSGIQLAQTMNR